MKKVTVEQAAEMARNKNCTEAVDGLFYIGQANLAEIINEALEAALKAGDVQAPKEGWISVEDRLPEPYILNDATEYKGVLAYVVSEHSGWGGYPMLLWYGEFPKYDEDGYEIEGETQFGWHYERDSEGEFDTLTFNMNGKVSHWMPVKAAPPYTEGK